MDGVKIILKDADPKEEEAKLAKKSGRKTLSENQEEFCKLVATKGMDPLEAMLEIFPNRKSYSIGNQRMLARKMKENPKIIKRLEELFAEIRDNQVLGDMYNFDKGVKLLVGEIEKAKEYMENGSFSEALHRIILTSVQELNRMYGFNIIDKNGNSRGSVNITFVNVKKPEEVER